MRDQAFDILVVDDDPIGRAQLRFLLTRYGYPVTVAEDGHEAWEMVVKRYFPICITDWNMPVMSGLELCRRIRRRGDPDYTYLIVLTGRTDKDNVRVGLEAGADDYITKPFDRGELLARLRVARRILTLQRSMRETERRLRLMAQQDGLTGVLNRRALDATLHSEMLTLGRRQADISIAMLDIDHFKGVNDTYGHRAGDAVLQAVAGRMQDVVREGDLVARYGGEEFLVVLSGAGRKEARAVAERIRVAVEEAPVRTSAGDITVTISIGIATAPPDYLGTQESLVETADRALYRAKECGRNRVCADEDLLSADAEDVSAGSISAAAP